VLVIVLVGAADYLLGKIPFQPFIDLNKDWNHKVGDWLNIWTILAIYTIAWLLIWSVRARGRMVVEKLVNYAGKELDEAVDGASMILLTKLGQLHDLYQTVDEQRAISTAALDPSIKLEHRAAIDAKINVDTVEAFLKDAVSAQSTLSLGPLQIPIGVLLSLIGHIAQGPRIVGSVHKNGGQGGRDRLVLTAQATRKEKSFTWYVERELSSEQSSSASLIELIDEFAYRVFTDMTLSSTVRWRAASSFAEGLRAYRQCLRTPKERVGNLQLAEEKFIETLTEDTQYTLAHYNLGVVLTELQRKDAATAAFERAIAEESRSSQAYYALALNCYQDEQYYRACQLCKRVIDLKPDPGTVAKAYQLTAMALAEIEIAREDPSRSNKVCVDAIKCGEKAIKYAHKALRRTERTQQDDVSESNDRVLRTETLLSVCICSLAKIYLPELLSSEESLSCLLASASGPGKRKFAYLRKARKLLESASKLHSSDASYAAFYHWELGRIYSALGDCKEAAQYLRIAVRVAPYRIEYLADLIFNHARGLATLRQKKSDMALDWQYEDFLFHTFLDLISTLDFTSATEKDTVKAVKAALETVLSAYKQKVSDQARYEEKLRHIRMIRTFVGLGCKIGAYRTPEKLARMTKDELGKAYKAYKDLEQRYDTCTRQCYTINEACREGSTNVLSEQTSSSIAGKVNKMLCLSQVVLAWGWIQLQLSRNGQNGADRLADWLEVLNEFDVRVQAVNKQPDWEWEQGQILSTLATLSYETGKRQQEMGKADAWKLFKRAERSYGEAIEILKEKYPRGISVQNLRSARALVLLELQGRQQEALSVAQKSITLDAMNYKNYETLGEVYFKCGDFSNAIETWKRAIARKNTTVVEVNDPHPYIRLGNAYLALAQSHHGICINDRQCLEAVRYLEHALKCCTDEHVQERLSAYCSLGYLYCTNGDYDQAIKYLHLTQRFGFVPYTSTFYLAYANLRKRDYDEALRQFRILQEKTEDLQGNDDEILEADHGGHICLTEMKALARWGEAYTLAERDIYPKDLLCKAEDACELAEKVPAEKLQFPSRYAHCKGWILYKLAKLEPPENANVADNSPPTNIEKAIEILRDAAKLEAQPEIYLHLAQAYQHKLALLGDFSGQLHILENIRACCRHARDLSGDDQSISLQIDNLLKSLPT
jgi:tetratricopeptide (TPR) repeat protein